MKKCSKCNQVKELSQFVTDKRKSFKKGSRCLECERQRSAERRASNREHDAFFKKRWKKNNKAKVQAQWAEYRASKIQATASWANKQYIQDLYDNCRDAELIFQNVGVDVKFHVDHIIPLKHKQVCGLHVEHNLQILTAEENTAKSNKYEVL